LLGDQHQKYCDCVFEVRGKRSAYNPYAVCTKSIYNIHGEKGPGITKCQYTEKFIRSQPDQALIAFLEEKNIDTSRFTREDLEEQTLYELDIRGEIIPE